MDAPAGEGMSQSSGETAGAGSTLDFFETASGRSCKRRYHLTSRRHLLSVPLEWANSPSSATGTPGTTFRTTPSETSDDSAASVRSCPERLWSTPARDAI